MRIVIGSGSVGLRFAAPHYIAGRADRAAVATLDVRIRVATRGNL